MDIKEFIPDHFASMAKPGFKCIEGARDGIAWYNGDGKLHREGGPAFEGADGSKAWYRNGERHRDDGPAYEGADGSKEWWRNGELLRVERVDGSKEWWRNGKLRAVESVVETRTASLRMKP